MYDDTARIEIAAVKILKSARSGGKVVGNETTYWDSLTTKWYEYALMVVTILVGIVLLPVLMPLYLIPSVREAFEQLAYEDAMRG